MNNFFQDNHEAIRNNTGAFHVYQNRFLRSKVSDISSFTGIVSAIVQNSSVGSASFMNDISASNLHIQGNEIYNTTKTAIIVSIGNAVMLDNLIRNPFDTPSVVVKAANVTMAGNTFAGVKKWPVIPFQLPFNHGRGAYATNGHPVELAVDGDPLTYFICGMFGYQSGVKWHSPYKTKKVVTKYPLTSAINNEGLNAPNLDPKDFEIWASNDWGDTWTFMDRQTNVIFNQRLERKEFTFINTTPYSMYEIRVKKNRIDETPRNGNWVSFAEFELTDANGNNVSTTPNSFVCGTDEDWQKHY
jgi:hypothetical protein